MIVIPLVILIFIISKLLYIKYGREEDCLQVQETKEKCLTQQTTNGKILLVKLQIVEISHGEKKITKEQIREHVRSHFKKPQVSVFGLEKAFGGGRTRGFVLVYDNEDSLKKYEPPARQLKVTLFLYFS